MAGQIHQIQPQYPRMIPKKRSFLEDYLPNMAQIFSQALLQQGLWEKRQKIGEAAEEKTDIRERQQHFEDLGYPVYDPSQEALETWGPETRKVGDKYFGTQPSLTMRDLPGMGGKKLLDYKGQMQVVGPEKETERVPTIKSVDVGNEIQIYRDGVLTKTYEKGKDPGKGKEGKITMSKVLPSGFINKVEIDENDAAKIKDYEGREYIHGTLTERKETKPEMTEREALKEIGVVKEKIAKLKEMGPSGEVGIILQELRKQRLGDVADQAEGKSVEEAIRIFEGYVDYLGKHYVKKETAEEFFPTEKVVPDWRKYR